MSERYRHSSGVGYSYGNQTKMESEFSPKKTMIILVIVVGCFAVLWPKVFYPMLVGSANQHMKPSAIDKTTGCCYVLSDTDVDTIKIMSELCGNIIKAQMGDMPLTGKQIINICQDEVLKACGIDISAVLQEQVRLGQTTKQILNEIRSLNGSLCLKYNFGVPPWRLGVPHIITLKNTSENVRQERPVHVRSEMVHPAFRERGRAIPQTASPSRPPPRILEGRPGPIPGMRPTIGGAGHVVPPPKQGTGSMSVIMPIYTIGIVIFFTYTLMKIIFKKHPDTSTIYSMENDPRYRKEVLGENVSRGSRDSGSCKLVVNAMSALLDEVDQEIEARRQSSEVSLQDDHSTNLSNGSVKKEEKPSVKIMGMETSESCEGGKKWQSANSSVLPTSPPPKTEHIPPPQEIYLDRALPPQSQILVADSATETEKNFGDDPAIVLAGKMTLSVISLENEDIQMDHIESADIREIIKEDAVEISKPLIKEEINEIIEKAMENIIETRFDDMKMEEVVNDIIEEENGMKIDDLGQEKGVRFLVKDDNCDKLETSNEMTLTSDTDLEDSKMPHLESSNIPNKDEIVKDNTEDYHHKEASKIPNFETSDISNQNEPIEENTNTQETLGNIVQNEEIIETSNTILTDAKSQPSIEKNVAPPPLSSHAKSTSEDSGSTVLSTTNSVINIGTKDLEHELNEQGEEQFGSDESEVEYEEEEVSGSEEIEISEAEDELEENEIGRESETVERLNGNAVLINGSVPHNDTPEEEDSEEEVVEEIIEEYSEEEEEQSEEENNDLVHLSSNGN